eukprot:jgi/Tetstr1/447164/TSEL_034601.t1
MGRTERGRGRTERGRAIVKELGRHGKRMDGLGYAAKLPAKGRCQARDIGPGRGRGTNAVVNFDGARAETWARSTGYSGFRDRLARDARASEVNSVLAGLGELQRFGSMFAFRDWTLMAAESRFPREAVARVESYVERGAGCVAPEGMRRSCAELTRAVKRERLRRRAREVELAHALRAKGLHRRRDSRLCAAFLNGTVSKTAFEVAEVMARFRFLYGGFSPAFNETLSNYVIVDALSDDDDELGSELEFGDGDGDAHGDGDADADAEAEADGRREYVDEEGARFLAFPVTQTEFVAARRREAESWSRFPAVWPWLEHKVVRVQRWWRETAANPYTRAGRNRMLREFEELLAYDSV